MCWGIDQFFKNKYRGIKSLSQHFEKEIYQYVNITWLFLTRKQLCWSPFFILSISKFLRAPILKNICERLLLKMCPWNSETLKFIIRSFNFTFKKTGFFNINMRIKFMIDISWLFSHEIYIDIQYFFKQKKIKSSRKEYLMWTCFKFWLMKNIFRKL